MSERIPFGPIGIDPVTFEGALDAIERLVARGEGGTVFTPNVDHIVMAESDARFRAAYAKAALSLADGAPVVWASKLLRKPLPAKVSGSDLVEPLLARAADRGWRVFFFGGAPGVAERARDRLVARYPKLQIVGIDSSAIGLDDPPAERAALVDRIRATRPDLVLVALGAPKQEIFCDQAAAALRPAVLVGIGASLDFIAGVVKRAPVAMQRAGLEWLYRLTREPGRLWRRYLLRDPKFLVIVARELAGRTSVR